MTKKILVIDDDPVTVGLLSSRLKANQYDVSMAGDGAEGLVKLKEEKPDLIILDVAMPKMDGYTFVQEFKKVTQLDKTPIIMLTSRDQMKDLFTMEGIKDYVVKPFNIEELLKKIRGYLK